METPMNSDDQPWKNAGNWKSLEVPDLDGKYGKWENHVLLRKSMDNGTFWNDIRWNIDVPLKHVHIRIWQTIHVYRLHIPNVLAPTGANGLTANIICFFCLSVDSESQMFDLVPAILVRLVAPSLYSWCFWPLKLLGHGTWFHFGSEFGRFRRMLCQLLVLWVHWTVCPKPFNEYEMICT